MLDRTMITWCWVVYCLSVLRQRWLLGVCSCILGTLLFFRFRQRHGRRKVMLWKSFEEPGTRPLPHLRKHVALWKQVSQANSFTCSHESSTHLTLFSADLTQPHSTGPAATLCPTLGTHALQNKRIQDICISRVDSSRHMTFSCVRNCAKCGRAVWLTHFFAVLTHHGADPRWAKLLSTQQTAGHAVPAHRLLHVIQAVYQSSADAKGSF